MSYDYNALVTNLAAIRSKLSKASVDDDTNQKYVELLQESIQLFDELSGHCPMTPLLWMQYAHDMGQLMRSLNSKEAHQTRLQTLELGLNEFPGSAVLQLHYCELLVSTLNDSDTVDDDTLTTVQQALQSALAQVGSGSHANEGEIVAQLYRVQAQFCLKHVGRDAALASLLQRARTPLGTANEGLLPEIKDFLAKHKTALPDQAFEAAVDDARRWESKAFSRLRPCEEEVTTAMHQEQILVQNTVDFVPDDNDDDDLYVTTRQSFVDAVLLPPNEQPRFWMGLGGALTAKAFLQYVAACRKFRFPKEEEEEDGDPKQVDPNNNHKKQQQQLILAVLERAIAECPTVESLWLAYLKHLTWLWVNDPSHAPSPMAFKAVANRAIRNCPFSLAVAQQQLHVCLLLSNSNSKDHDALLLDPDELLQMVNKALNTKFLPLPAQALDLFVTAIRVMQRRILTLMATTVVGLEIPTAAHKKKKQKNALVVLPFDTAELVPNNKNKQNATDPPAAAAVKKLDDESWQEVQDLCEEIRDMFDAAAARLQKDHASWTHGRAILQHQRSLVEQHVLVPLLQNNNNNNTDSSNDNGDSKNNHKDVLAHFEKVIRLHNPPHPDSYRALIQYVLQHGSSTNNNKSPGDVVSRLRQVRGLYQKAVQSVGAPKPSRAVTSGMREYETALAALCHDYQEFERIFGSEPSLANATRMMHKKLQKAAGGGRHQSEKEKSSTKEQEEAMDIDQHAAEPKRKRNESNASESQDPPTKKQKKEANETTAAAAAATTTTDKPAGPANQPKKHHKVKIGHIFHRAHPFTVRISNLADETEEMDMIEFFKNEHKCGAVVHCRVQREKQLNAKGGKPGASKGWGLLQFEERESVEQCLALDQQVVLNDKTLRIERSHVPAVGLVPPGMHRPKHSSSKPKSTTDQAGEDKGTKPSNSEQRTKPPAPKKETKGSSSVTVLAFRPRGVGKKQNGPKRSKPKVKLAMPSDKSNEPDTK
ncbi:expressed unknown protein [Seminavis robusta]|uniref:RRM domain-containing protein n=1 Tax=Seminavis robusta TaxID=568900 RepID=A0A9N8HAK7_9STRA|nr:expressed unknown protein [Seminavis robusta]|eukprot:Sro228_g092770.1 n/a (989) ;mRNA; f:66268-69234